MKKLITLHIFTSLLFMVSIGIGVWIYQSQQQFTTVSKICYLASLIISITQIPLTIKISNK